MSQSEKILEIVFIQAGLDIFENAILI